jgi:hypothetical protein
VHATEVKQLMLDHLFAGSQPAPRRSRLRAASTEHV